MLDLDALAAAEGQSWVFHGARFLRPGCDRCLVLLSPGGSDAHVVREFDPAAKAFVPGGFTLPLAKSTVELDRSGHPVRGHGVRARLHDRLRLPADRQDLEARHGARPGAGPCSRAGPEDMAVEAYHDATEGFERDFVLRRPSFFTQELHQLGRDGTLTPVELPLDAEADVQREWLVVKLRSPWTVGTRSFPAGALLAADFDAYQAGKRRFMVLFRPTARRSLESWSWTRHHLILNLLHDVKNRLFLLTPGRGGWKREPFQGAPALGSVAAHGVDPRESDACFMTVTDFLTPDSLWLGEAGQPPERLKSAPAFFDAEGLELTQHFTISAGRHPDPLFPGGPQRVEARRHRTRPCSTATAASRSRWCPTTAASWAAPGWTGAASTWWPTSAAAANTGPAGTRRR